jgi:hypothetical protein
MKREDGEETSMRSKTKLHWRQSLCTKWETKQLNAACQTTHNKSHGYNKTTETWIQSRLISRI